MQLMSSEYHFLLVWTRYLFSPCGECRVGNDINLQTSDFIYRNLKCILCRLLPPPTFVRFDFKSNIKKIHMEQQRLHSRRLNEWCMIFSLPGFQFHRTCVFTLMNGSDRNYFNLQEPETNIKKNWTTSICLKVRKI